MALVPAVPAGQGEHPPPLDETTDGRFVGLIHRRHRLALRRPVVLIFVDSSLALDPRAGVSDELGYPGFLLISYHLTPPHFCRSF